MNEKTTALMSDTVRQERAEYVCPRCWHVFDDPTKATCPNFDVELGRNVCDGNKPGAGWPSLPYAIRPELSLVKKLDSGGMGAVFLAERTVPIRTSAVKVVTLLGTEETRRARLALFSNECVMTQMMYKLSRLHYVRYLDHSIGGDDSRIPPYLEMEFVQHPTLRHWLHNALQRGIRSPQMEGGGQPLSTSGERRRGLSALEIVRIGIAITESLQVMHRHGYVHRDLKLSNMFIDPTFPKPTIKIFDFGLCVQDNVDPESASFPDLYPNKNQILGSEAYMSPEQMDRLPLRPTSDIHTVGSILWYMATGKVPFPADDGSHQEEKLQRRRQLVKHIPPRPETMPPGLYETLKEALDPDPQRRFPRPQQDRLNDDYTSAMGMGRQLRVLEQQLITHQEKARAQNRDSLKSLEGRLTFIEKKVEPTIQLSGDVTGCRKQLSELQENAHADQLGDPSTYAQISALTENIRGLESRVKNWPGSQPLFVWLPWVTTLMAVGLAGYLYTRNSDAVSKERAGDSPANEDVVSGPGESPDTTGDGAHSCPPQEVQWTFDRDVRAVVGVASTDPSKQLSSKVWSGMEAVAVTFVDPWGLCKSDKPLIYQYDDLVRREPNGECVVVPPSVIEVSKTCLGAE